MIKSRERLNKAVLSVLFILISVALFMKCFVGFGWNDEAYYLVLAERFAKGDILLYHDWYPTQWVGIILAPFFLLFEAVTGGTSGIVLAFRILFCVLLIVEAALVWKAISVFFKNDLIGFIAGVILLIYSTENKASYSYSDIAVHCMVATAILIMLAFHRDNKWIFYYLAGLFFVISVICNPYIMIVYIWLVICAFVCKKKNGSNFIRELLWFTCGCLTIGVPILIYIVCNAPIADIVTSIQYMLNMPDHSAKNIVIETVKWCWYSLKSYTIVGIAIQCAIVAYIVISKITGKSIDRLKKYILWIELGLSVLYVLVQYFLMDDKNVIGIAYVPVVITSMILYLITENRHSELMILLVIPGLLISLSFQWGSDTGIFAMMTGYAVAAVAAVIVIYDYYCEYYLQSGLGNRAIYCVIIFFLVSMVSYTLVVRLSYTRRADREEVYNTQAVTGPYAGVLTDENQLMQYEQTLQDARNMKTLIGREDNVLVLGSADNCWIYLALDRPIGAFFCFRVDADHEYFDDYYTMHPKKIPMCVYINEYSKEYGENSIVVGGYRFDAGDSGKVFLR